MISSEPSNALAVTFSESQVVLCFSVPIVCILCYTAVPRNRHSKSALALQLGTVVCVPVSKQAGSLEIKWYVDHNSKAENIFS